MKLIWDTNIQFSNIVEARGPDNVLVEKIFSITDIAVPVDVRCSEKELRK